MGLPNFTFHSLRHTHATLLLKKRINSKVLGNRLDHSTLFQQIMDTYGHFIPDLEMGVKNTEKDKSYSPIKRVVCSAPIRVFL